MNIIERLKLEGLEVNRDIAGYWTINDSEGHVIIMDVLQNEIVICDNEGVEESFHPNQDNMIVYSVLSALDYEFDE